MLSIFLWVIPTSESLHLLFLFLEHMFSRKLCGSLFYFIQVSANVSPHCRIFSKTLSRITSFNPISPYLSFKMINGNLLQYSCLENPMDGGAWWATVHGVTKSWTRLSDLTLTLSLPDILYIKLFFSILPSRCEYSEVLDISLVIVISPAKRIPPGT